MISFEEFDAIYCALTGHDGACRWQYRLFCDLHDGRFPTDVELATGLGKTSIIAIWAVALAVTVNRSPSLVPRRLAYVVDRRVVVDQASSFADEIRERLEAASGDPSHVLFRLSSNLRDAGCTPGIIETSTLRGQRTLDTRWRNDPARPAVLVGTVDMLGSRLLFSAFGRVGPWGRSLEAGLLGQDCLVVLDEAHLCSPFASTMSAIERRASSLAPFSVIRMGATMAPVVDLLTRTPGLPDKTGRGNGESQRRKPFVLRPDEAAEKKVSDRLNASKSIELLESAVSPGEQLAEWALGKTDNEPAAAIGIVLNTVAQAQQCLNHLIQLLAARGLTPESVDLVSITGSMRGWDRDEVVESDTFARFKSRRDRSAQHSRPAFLIATSCIEVGADLDCDHLGTQACAVDSLIQRLGRVNRLGTRTTASTVLIVGKADDEGPPGRVFSRLRKLEAAVKRLRRRTGDQESPQIPFECKSAEFCMRLMKGNPVARGLIEGCVPPPALTPAVLDDLAMTSKYPDCGARPDVGRWLHGSVDEASLYVELAWRDELDVVKDGDGAVALLSAFPISPRETARCPLFEAVELLTAIREWADDNAIDSIMLVSWFGELTPHVLRSLPTDEAELRDVLHDALIILPTSAGGYDGRFVDRQTVGRSAVSDIAEEEGVQSETKAQRQRLWINSGRISDVHKSVEQVTGDRSFSISIDVETPNDELMSECAGVAPSLLGSGWRLVACAGTARLGVLVARECRHAVEEAEADEAAVGFEDPIPLDQHLSDARRKAELLCDRLLNRTEVDANLRSVIVEAAGSHDLGKNRPWWQRAVGNSSKQPVAKSGRTSFNHSINRGYRHEIGSVADLLRDAPATSELCLHLIAAHHGHSRPGFPLEAAGPIPLPAIQQAVEQAAARFVQLQSKYGWWGLAWLEALVKAADVLASVDEEDAP